MKINKRKILEDMFFRPVWYSIFLNPYFINRKSLFESIKRFAKEIKKDEKVLDVGCGLKPYRNLFNTKNYIGIDIEGGGHTDEAKTVDKFYDGENIPFENNSFDHVICTQVLEHAENPYKLIDEINRVLKIGGTIFISMPFTYPEHEIPYDFRRFTKYQHQKMLSDSFDSIEIKKTTGFCGTFGQLFVIHIFESIKFKASLLKTFLSVFILAPIQLASLIFDYMFRKYGMTIDYIITARKR